MKLKIRRKKREGVLFGDLDRLSVFEYQGKLLLKFREWVEGTPPNSIDLETGDHMSLPGGAMVYPRRFVLVEE